MEMFTSCGHLLLIIELYFMHVHMVPMAFNYYISTHFTRESL